MKLASFAQLKRHVSCDGSTGKDVFPNLERKCQNARTLTEFKDGTNINFSFRNQLILAKRLVIIDPHVHSRGTRTGGKNKGLVPVII